LPPVEEFPPDGVGVMVGAVDALGVGAAAAKTLGAGAGFGVLTVMAGLAAGFLRFATFLGADLRVTFFATFFRAVFFFAVFFPADFFAVFLRADFFAADLRVTFRATFFRAIFVLDFTRAFLDLAAFFAERFFFDAFFAAIFMPPDLTRFALITADRLRPAGSSSRRSSIRIPC
jgi:hypothetical protein